MENAYLNFLLTAFFVIWGGLLVVLFCLRVYWYFTEGYGYLSWFAEWLLGVVCTIGIYIVIFDQPIFYQWFWWLVLFAVLASSLYRLKSKRLKEMMEPLTSGERVFIYSLMGLFTFPIVIILFWNAANLSGVWDLS